MQQLLGLGLTDENNKRSLVTVEAKIPGEHIDKAAADALTNALRIPSVEIGSLLGDLIGIAGDHARAYRHTKRVEILAKAQQHAHKLGLTTDQFAIPPEGQIYTMLEAFADVDDPTLQDLWARLFASTLDPKNNSNEAATFIPIVRQFTPQDAQVFELVAFVEQYNREKAIACIMVRDRGEVFGSEESSASYLKINDLVLRAISERLKVSSDLLNIDWPELVENLERLGAVGAKPPDFPISHSPRMDGFHNASERELIQNILEQLEKLGMAINSQNISYKVPPKSELAYHVGHKNVETIPVQLTPFGTRLATVLGLLDEKLMYLDETQF